MQTTAGTPTGLGLRQPSGAPGPCLLPVAARPTSDGGRGLPQSKTLTRDESALPVISKPLRAWFTWYSRRYLRRHFNSLRVTGADFSPETLRSPIVVYSNHASWWDPLVGLLLGAELLQGKNIYAPMDATALERYGFFKRLGAFGVEQNSRRGGVQFLRTARTVLQDSETALWLTPQSRFADARERPVRFKSGIGHLPGMAREIHFVPVAVEYVFWEERLPEILVRFGEPYRATLEDRSVKPEWWAEFFADRLRETQDELARQSQRREPAEFRCLLRGRTGVGGIYDRWRQFRAGLSGKSLQLEHGKL
jgi:1-acyl-sn-glycerol-3-phosphate acyltransferase